jgi:predicted nucleic acid-binding protein
MKFWDGSALVPLVLQERESETLRALIAADRDLAVWALSSAEVTSALWRRARSGELDESARVEAAEALGELEGACHVVSDVAQIAARARRLLAVHPLRAADACQLAAALVTCRERTDSLEFVTLDDRLADAARREGLRVLPGR